MIIEQTVYGNMLRKFSTEVSENFFCPAALYTFCTHVYFFCFAPRFYFDLLQIGHEPSFINVVGVTDTVAHYRFFTADCAFFTHVIPPVTLSSVFIY